MNALIRCILMATATLFSGCSDFLSPSSIPSSVEIFEGKTISLVTLQFTGERAPSKKYPTRFQSLISNRPGDLYEQERIDEDIRTAYESGLVEDIKVLSEKDGSSIKLIYLVSPHASFLESNNRRK